MFWQWCCWWSKSCGMLDHGGWYVVTSELKDTLLHLQKQSSWIKAPQSFKMSLNIYKQTHHNIPNNKSTNHSGSQSCKIEFTPKVFKNQIITAIYTNDFGWMCFQITQNPMSYTHKDKRMWTPASELPNTTHLLWHRNNCTTGT